MNETYVQHAHIKSFAENKVNVKNADLVEYRKQVSNLRTHLKKFIQDNPDYGFVKTLHSGSVKKGTALKTINDMDIALYIVESDSNQGDDLKPWLIEKLQKAYPTKSSDDFTEKRHCVNISFIGTGLNVDVVPIYYEDDPDDKGYLIAQDTGEKVLTSVKLHIDFIRQRKNSHPTHFAQIVRLMKWWKRECKKKDEYFRFKSFMIELLCAKLADDGLELSDYPEALEKIFKYIIETELTERIYFEDNYDVSSLPASSSTPMEFFDPVNPDNNAAYSYTLTDRAKIVEFAQDAFDAIIEARYSTTKGRAVSLWQEVLGSSLKID